MQDPPTCFGRRAAGGKSAVKNSRKTVGKGGIS